jgi:uncharacterized protein
MRGSRVPYLVLALITTLVACTSVSETPSETTGSEVSRAAAPAALVISQVYGGGGNTGAPYTHDFVELFNRGSVAAALHGLSIQYASAEGSGAFGANASQLTVLPNVTLAPGQYLLIQQAGGINGVPLPTPDVVAAAPISMAAGSGKVALVDGTASLGCNGGSTPCTAEQLARIVDLVGYGNADFYEGSGAVPTLSNTTAGLRTNSGCTDTDDNGADFVASVPVPRNTASPLTPCSARDILDTFDAAVGVDELQGAGPAGSAAQRLQALRNMLVDAQDLVRAGDLGGACRQYGDASKRIHAEGPLRSSHFVTGLAARALYDLIADRMAALGC